VIALEIYKVKREEEKSMGFLYSQIKHFYLLPPNRLEKRCRENIQAQTLLFNCKRRRRDKRSPAFVLDEKHVFWQEAGFG